MNEVTLLTPADFHRHPVWRFSGSDERGETLVSPVAKLPAKSLQGCVVGVDLVLASGKKVLAMCGNVDLENPQLAEHFMTFSFYRHDGALFHLARYHDFDAAERGPAQLARFLGLPIADIFPARWDLTPHAVGAPAALQGVLNEGPRERLTRSEIIALAVHKTG